VARPARRQWYQWHQRRPLPRVDRCWDKVYFSVHNDFFSNYLLLSIIYDEWPGVCDYHTVGTDGAGRAPGGSAAVAIDLSQEDPELAMALQMYTSFGYDSSRQRFGKFSHILFLFLHFFLLLHFFFFFFFFFRLVFILPSSSFLSS
jgi:hypothetical protein